LPGDCFPTVINLLKAVLKSAGPDLLAGLLCALMTLAYASSFATLIFGGVLAPYVNQAVMAALISSVLTLLVLSWRSSFHFVLGGPDSNPSAILAVTVAAIAAEIARGGRVVGPDLVPTVLFFLFLSATGCGLILYLVGERRWGRYIRYIPYQVVGGFLVGTGYLLLAGGWKMLTGAGLFDTTRAQLEAVPGIAWAAALVVCATLLVLMRLRRHFLVIPGVIFTAIFLFHVVLHLKGLTPEAARLQGLLLEPLQVGAWSHPFNQPWGVIRWDLILFHAYDFAAMTMVVLITILLNANSLEHAVNRDADFDQELKSLGLANIVTGLAGGIVAVNSYNRSLLNLRAGARTPWATRVCAGLILITMLFAPHIVGWLPKSVLTGLILYLGCSLLIQWLWDGRRGVTRGDYLIMLVILGTVMALGIVPGVVVGIVASSLSFIVNLSRSPVVKQFTGATRHSNVERSERDTTWLRSHGELLQGAVLHGYLFFGTSSTLPDQLQGALQRARVLTIDFWQVRGIDATSVMVLRKLIRLAAEARVELVVTGLADTIRARLSNCGLDFAQAGVREFPDLDHGLEWAEDSLLAEAQLSVSLAEVLGGLNPEEEAAATRYFEWRTAVEGATLVRAGDPSDVFFIMLDGQVSIYVTIPGTEYRKRVGSYGPGTIVGEMGFFSGEPRSADIMVDRAARFACISRSNLDQMEVGQPGLAGRLHRMVINTLATRLRAANRAMADQL
jgi:SulP family sulfate permease